MVKIIENLVTSRLCRGTRYSPWDGIHRGTVFPGRRHPKELCGL